MLTASDLTSKLWLKYTLLALSLQLLPGCAVLLGSVDPVEELVPTPAGIEKKFIADWNPLDSQNNGQVYQHKATQALLSSKQTCQKVTLKNDSQSLKKAGEIFLMGIDESEQISEKNFIINNYNAYESIIKGSIDGSSRSIRLTVIKIRNCLLDIVMISDPQSKLNLSADYEQFRTEQVQLIGASP